MRLFYLHGFLMFYKCRSIINCRGENGKTEENYKDEFFAYIEKKLTKNDKFIAGDDSKKSIKEIETIMLS